jgi:hypothetical protein
MLLAALGLFARSATGAEEKWKTPDAPKDDQHWYPELPDNKDPHETLPNAGFEDKADAAKGRPERPKGWAYPDGVTALWQEDEDHGKVIVLDTNVLEVEAKQRQAELRLAAEKQADLPAAKPKTAPAPAQKHAVIGATYGVSYYSEKIQCKLKQAYKISFDYKGASGGAKVWVRGWGTFKGEDRRRWEMIVNCRTQGGGWRHFEQAFHPTRRPTGKDSETHTEIAYLRVMLYAYWPAGRYAFDNVKVEEIDEAEFKRLKAIPADGK